MCHSKVLRQNGLLLQKIFVSTGTKTEYRSFKMSASYFLSQHIFKFLNYKCPTRKHFVSIGLCRINFHQYRYQYRSFKVFPYHFEIPIKPVHIFDFLNFRCSNRKYFVNNGQYAKILLYIGTNTEYRFFKIPIHQTSHFKHLNF